MTQKEKTKVYDKFVEELKSKFKDFQVIIYNKNDLEKFFPELREESEDDRIRKSLIYYLHGLGEFEYPDKETYNNWLTWLEKQGEQTPAWSEEDEEIYSRICHLIHSAAFENYDVDEVGKELGKYAKITDWLKAIKTRCAWKPSDEQMNDLKIAIDSFTFEKDYLQELYENLKKLKGE